MSEPMTPRQLADALAPRDRATLRSLTCALRSVRASNLYNDQRGVPNANSLTRDAFLSAATAALSLELAEALLAAIVDTGEDFDTCLDMVADVPQAYLIAVHTQVLAAALDMATALTWLEEHPDAARDASILPVRLLDPPAAPEPYDHGAAKEDARSEAAGDYGYDFSDWGAAREGVANALRRIYGPINAESIINADAFGALVNRIVEHGLALGGTPLAILQAVAAGDRDFAIRGADEPAAFLAAKVRDL